MATVKQKLAIKKALENGGNVTAAMREAKYKPTTYNNPQNLTKSKAWEELLEEYLPDDLLATKINEGLDANRTISASVIIKSDDPTVRDKQANGRTMDFIDVPDFAVRHKYVETSLKIKGKLIDRHELTGQDGEPIIVKIEDYGAKDNPSTEAERSTTDK